MAYNYIDEKTGIEKKRIVELNIEALLQAGIPLDIISESPKFNPRHYEMLKNIRRGYHSKEEEVIELFERVGFDEDEPIVGESYSEVVRPVDEEYPDVDKSEELFIERTKIDKDVETRKRELIKKLEKEKKRLLSSISKYETKYPVIERIKSYCDDYDALVEKNEGKPLSLEITNELMSKYALTAKDNRKYGEIYKTYTDMCKRLDQVIIELDSALNQKFSDELILSLIERKNNINIEILKLNTKLVNGFIRQKYPTLLVESEELFQTCYIALWNAIQVYDINYNANLASLAYKYMDTEVKRNFKELTGYKWTDYWGKRKVKILLDTTSRLMERKVSIPELADMGLLSMSERQAYIYLNLAEEYSISELFPVQEVDGIEYAEEINDTEETLPKEEEEILDLLEYDSDDDVEYDAIYPVLKEHLSDILDTLTEREKRVLELRYGLEDGRARTLEEVAKEFNVTSQTIRMIEAKALRKLRRPSRMRPIVDYLDLEHKKK